MSSGTLIRIETRTDFLGEYTAYVYGDGHVETEPSDRPVTKEDYQRRRAADLSQKNAREALASARIARSTSRANLNRDQAASAATAGLFDEMRKTLSAINLMAQTTGAPSSDTDTVINTVSVGGQIVGPRATVKPDILNSRATVESERDLR